MKANTVLVVTAASILLTGSAALAVNSETLKSPPAGSSVPANIAFLTQTDTVAGTASPTSTPSPSVTEDAGPGSSSQPAALVGAGPNNGPSAPGAPALADDHTAAPQVAPEPEPSRFIEPNDDHGGHGEQEPGDDKQSVNDDDDRGRSDYNDDHGGHGGRGGHGGHTEQEPGDDKHSGNDH